MDTVPQDENGGGKKMGLARLAKARSISSSLNNLSSIEGKSDSKDDVRSLRGQEIASDSQASPQKSLSKHGAPVSLLPNKMHVSALGGQHTNERKVKERSISSTTPPVSSPLLPGRSRLSPPQVKRSSSVTLLSEAITQMHSLCVFPAHPKVMAKEADDSTESCPVSVHKSSATTRLLSPEIEGGRLMSWPAGISTSDDSVNTSHTEREQDSMVYSSRNYLMQSHRSASLDELSNVGGLLGLPTLTPENIRQKNYLFGGMGSLLGATELDRYLPSRSITIFIATWNMNGKEPPTNLEDFLLPDTLSHVPDMFVVGTQESGGSRSEWEVRLQATIGPSHVLFTSAIFGVLHLTIFLRRDLLWFCSVPEEDTYSLRPGVAYKTKGGVALGFQFFGTRLLFINSHLTAHEEKQALRIQNFKNITHSLDIPRLLPHKQKHKNVTHRYDCVFWLGDLNFRLAVNRDHVFDCLKRDGPKSYQHLLQWDQLSQARQKGEAFSEFEEGAITFAPTFKFDPGTDHYDSSSKQRVPSYTDRILFKSNRSAVTCSSYSSCPLFRTSDHKPVSGVFQCKIRPGKDDVPLAAGLFNREVYLEALRRRRRFLYQPAFRNCPVQ